MSEPFRIHWSFRDRQPPQPFSADDFVDAAELTLALEQFLAAREGTFTLEFGSLRLELELDPDLSIVFKRLPTVFEQLVAAEAAAPRIYFAEQGTDLLLLLERHEDDLTVRFHKGHSVGKRFASLPETAPPVSATAFLSEWSRFLRAVLEEMVALRPALAQDESYRQFVAALAPEA